MVVTNEIENYITLSEEHRKNVCEELARIIFEYKKDKSVECIYFLSYKDLEDNVLEITIVRDDSIKSFKDFELREYSDIHKEQEIAKKCGVEISIHLDTNQEYIIPTDKSINASCYELFQSTILFDRDGKYSKLKKQLLESEGMISYYSNLAQIEPSIMDELNKVLTGQQMEEDTKCIRKSLKTNLFQEFKNM